MKRLPPHKKNHSKIKRDVKTGSRLCVAVYIIMTTYVIKLTVTNKECVAKVENLLSNIETYACLSGLCLYIIDAELCLSGTVKPLSLFSEI